MAWPATQREVSRAGSCAACHADSGVLVCKQPPPEPHPTTPGTHHAFRDYGSGFCIVNDLAVTAELLLHQGRVQRVLILDLDVHQVLAVLDITHLGNKGSQLLFQEGGGSQQLLCQLPAAAAQARCML